MGVFATSSGPVYDELMAEQLETAREQRKPTSARCSAPATPGACREDFASFPRLADMGPRGHGEAWRRFAALLAAALPLVGLVSLLLRQRARPSLRELPGALRRLRDRRRRRVHSRLRGGRGGEPARRRTRPAAVARVHGDGRFPRAPRDRDAAGSSSRRTTPAFRSRSRSGCSSALSSPRAPRSSTSARGSARS